MTYAICAGSKESILLASSSCFTFDEEERAEPGGDGPATLTRLCPGDPEEGGATCDARGRGPPVLGSGASSIEERVERNPPRDEKPAATEGPPGGESNAAPPLAENMVRRAL